MTCVNRMQHVAHTHNVLFNTVDNMAGERIVLVWILSLMSWTKGARVNIALRKTASTSLGNLDGWTADKAVDGNNNTNGESSTCFHGARGPSDWTVDLEYEYQLYDIKVYLRNGYNSRTADSIIYLDKNSSRVCYTFPSTISDNPTDVMCNGTAQHVTIKNPGNGPRHEDALNICEVEIYVCSNGSYGIDCTDSCGGCDDSSCDRWTGVCSGDCQAGYRGNKCDTMCSNGFYGIKCKEDCSNRKCYSNTGSCDAVSGSCDTGCRPGWIGTDCVKACRDQYYGSNCSSICEDRHCYGNSTCDHVTGSCDKGCDSGWKGTDCREQCDNEYYGRSCMMLCSSRHCEGNSSCDRITGKCVAGCQTGWAGSDCTGCANQRYGNSCDKLCTDRNCKGNSSCSTMAGSCDQGCQDGWMGVDCRGKNSSRPVDSLPIAAIVGGILGALVLILIIVLVIRMRRKTKQKREASHSKEVQDSALEIEKGPRVYQNVALEEDSEKPAPAGAIGLVQLNGQARGASENCDSRSVATLEEEEEDYDSHEQLEEGPGAPERNYYNLDDIDRGHVIDVSQLEVRVREFEENPELPEEEFQQLPNTFLHPYDESQKPANKSKNRFRGYYPYNCNRVVLHDDGDSDKGDYINASYLDGYNSPQRYIAAQVSCLSDTLEVAQERNLRFLVPETPGILPETNPSVTSRFPPTWYRLPETYQKPMGPYKDNIIDDFWRMIWQEGCKVVVMVTGLAEQGKMKCLRYWPETGSLCYGDITVTMETETVLADYTITKLAVQHAKDSKKRHMTHFHFTSWPDHGVPDTSCLLQFMWRINSTSGHQKHPIVVHCSAGIGRTGTYIAVESLLSQATTEGTVDVVSFVSNMRSQRKNMIQTKEQYMFIYQAVAAAVVEGDTSLDADVIRKIDLGQVTDVQMGNRTVNEHLDAMASYPETSTSDHMITVSSYTSRAGFFVFTSQPDKEELWSRIYHTDSRTLVTWEHADKSYLPSSDRSVSTSRLIVSMRSSTMISDNATLSTLHLHKKDDEEEMTIHHYHVTGSTRDPGISVLIGSLLQWTGQSECGSTIIVSQSVVETRHLLLLVNITSRLQDDGKMDVINSMRRLRSQLGGPQFTVDDVRLFLEFAQSQLESLGMYANL